VSLRTPLALLCLTATFLHAQAPEQQITTITTRSTLVVIPALVKTKSGGLVYTLTAKDFKLTDDGIEQPLILEEDNGGQPLALVVLIEADAANQSSGWHPESLGPPPDRLSTLATMIEALAGGVPHRIAVVGFDSRPKLLQDFTPDSDSVSSAINDFTALTGVDAGDHGAAILDSLGFAVDLLRRQPPQYRRAILLLSETNDRGSRLPLVDALRAISDTNTAIYSVAFSTGIAAASRYGHKELPTKNLHGQIPQAAGAPEPNAPESIAVGIIQALTTGIAFGNPDPYPAKGCMGSDPADAPQHKAAHVYGCLGQLAPPLTLAKMAAIAATDGLRRNMPETVARLTGGEYFKFTDAKSLERDLATISNHLPNRYVLSFQPQSPHPGPHAIQLHLRDRSNLTVTARTSYWADDDTTPP